MQENKYFAKYKNQKIIEINKIKRERYFSVGSVDISNAMKELSHIGLKLYIHMNFNGDGWLVLFSKKKVEEFTGITSELCDIAFQELVDKGYIVFEAERKYDFYPTPQQN